MYRFNFFIMLILASVFSHASDTFSILYEVEKDGKKIGHYQVDFQEKSLESYAYGASNKLEMFSTKKVVYVKNGLKNVEFMKNKNNEVFIVATKVSSLDSDLKKKFDRKFSKVEGDDMLFITKDNLNRIELFNKRKTTVKTLDELLSDIFNSKIDYDKFILFDKFGVMKMAADLSVSDNIYTIINGSKNKPYIKITTKDHIPVKIESLVSNWNLNIKTSGILKEYKLDFNELLSRSYLKELQTSKVVFSKAKKGKNSYEFDGELTFVLPSELENEKEYKQKEFCQKAFKKSKLKFKNIILENRSCITDIKVKMNMKELKENVLEILSDKHEELKITKKVNFNEDSITYEVF